MSWELVNRCKWGGLLKFSDRNPIRDNRGLFISRILRSRDLLKVEVLRKTGAHVGKSGGLKGKIALIYQFAYSDDLESYIADIADKAPCKNCVFNDEMAR
jgi:hypothetical protein